MMSGSQEQHILCQKLDYNILRLIDKHRVKIHTGHNISSLSYLILLGHFDRLTVNCNRPAKGEFVIDAAAHVIEAHSAAKFNFVPIGEGQAESTNSLITNLIIEIGDDL